MATVVATALESKSSACECVFGIFELAEAIFLALPPQQVLVNIQRVNRKWHEVVNHSTPLQQALFFRPITAESLHFVKIFGENRGGSWQSQYSNIRRATIYEHPLLGRLLMDQQPPSPALARPEASWRRQLLTQPAIATITLNVGKTKAHVKAEEVGVTMGLVYELAELFSTSSTSISDWSLWRSYLLELKQCPADEALAKLRLQ